MSTAELCGLDYREEYFQLRERFDALRRHFEAFAAKFGVVFDSSTAPLEMPALGAPTPLLQAIFDRIEGPLTTRQLRDLLGQHKLILPEGSVSAFVRRMELEGLVRVMSRGRGRTQTVLEIEREKEAA